MASCNAEEKIKIERIMKVATLLFALLCLQDVYCQDANITTVYLISSCHLDVGFADTAQNIVNEYFDKYFPNAVNTAKELRNLGVEERLVFTTHPYLVYLYLNCSFISNSITHYTKIGLHCPNQTQLQDFTDAIRRGDIVWHAFPFNAQMEFFDSALADFGFQLTHWLDAMFGRKATITMSQRDVPGTTRSIIPIMRRNGVQAITVGVNTASMPPAVPSVFNWKDPVSGESIIAMWHPHGYGGQNGPKLSDTVVVPGLNEALAFAIRVDNSGPPSSLEIFRNYLELRLMFPAAKIVAAGYDTFVEKLLTVKDKLPTYTEEIGDTWIYGVSSDPYKTAAARLIMRHFSRCMADSKCSLDNVEEFAFAALLTKNGEHTWGKDVKTYLHDTTHWSNDEFHSQLDEPNFKDMINSWVEQRYWGLYYPLEMLPTGNPLKSDILRDLYLLPFHGDINTFTFKQVDISTQATCGNFKIGFSSLTGAINHLQYSDAQNLITLATEANPIAEIVYETYTAEDYVAFLDQYVYDFGQWYIFRDLGKPGLSNTKKFNVSPAPKSLWFKETDESCVFLMETGFDPELISDYGAPQAAWTQVEVLKDSKSLNFTLYLVNKTSTRIPESLSLYFNPSGVDPQDMMMSKLGEYISVLDVIKNGSKHLHACDENGIMYSGAKGGVKVQSDDVALVCIGYPTPFPVPMETPDVSKGFSFNIVNNIWGTNYVMWYPYLIEDISSKYRFSLTVDL